MPVLEHLTVHLQLKDVVTLWCTLAKAPAIPTLKQLSLSICAMDMQDFTTFVSKHCSTWTSLTISHLRLCKSTKEELGDLYVRLSQAPNIELYHQRYLYFGWNHDNCVGMTGPVSCPFLDDEEDEDGFVTIHQTDRIYWKWHNEVTRVLSVLAGHMRS